MTFEEEYGAWLVRAINEKLKNINGKLCKQYDEVSFKPLKRNPDEIAIIISGGNATRSSVEGLDQNVLPLTITVLCKAKYSSAVRAAINAVQRTFNAVPAQFQYLDVAESEDEIVQQVKTVFSTPYVFDEVDFPTSKETVKACFISFSATVYYGQTAIVSPTEYRLKVGDEEYAINHIQSYDNAVMPAYDTFLPQGEARAKQSFISKTNSWAFTILKVKEDSLQTLFEQELNFSDGDGFGEKSLHLIANGNEIEIRSWQLLESYVDNAAAYVLTLGL